MPPAIPQQNWGRGVVGGRSNRGGGGHRGGMDQQKRLNRQKEREMKVVLDLWSRSPSPSPERKPKKKVPKVKKEKPKEKGKNSAQDAEDIVRVKFDDSDSDLSDVEDMGAKKSEQRRQTKAKKKSKKKSKKKRKRKKSTRKKRKKRKKKVISSSSDDSSSSSSSSSDSENDEYQNAIDAVDEQQKLAIKTKLDAEKKVEAEPADIGPRPMPKIQQQTQQANLDYGGALMPGEGDAIAQFVQNNMRIPRRGEVGWTGDEISNLEDLGYVMSGSRHKKMNAIRIRKENQVYSAEEKRALALYNFEEHQQRENKLMQEFREIITEKFAGS